MSRPHLHAAPAAASLDVPWRAGLLALSSGPVDEGAVEVPVAGGLDAVRYRPLEPRGTLVVGHANAVGHLSSRERFAATLLARAGFSTLLLGLVTEAEDCDDAHLDEALLAARWAEVARWWTHSKDGRGALGLVAVDDAVSAALLAAAREPTLVSAIVTRGWPSARMDGTAVPTLNIVVDAHAEHRGARWLAGLNHRRQRLVLSERDPGAVLDQVTSVGGAWFAHWLRRARAVD